jgi:hypothetical protein
MTRRLILYVLHPSSSFVVTVREANLTHAMKAASVGSSYFDLCLWTDGVVDTHYGCSTATTNNQIRRRDGGWPHYRAGATPVIEL